LAEESVKGCPRFAKEIFEESIQSGFDIILDAYVVPVDDVNAPLAGFHFSCMQIDECGQF
jgi:hypothetical protein